MKKKILILLFTLILIPISAKADSMEISCSSYSITLGGTTKCSVKALAHKIGGGEGKISVSNGTVQSFTVGTCNQIGTAVTNNEFTCLNEEDPNGVTFVTYVIKANSTGTMTFKVTDAKFVAISTSGQYNTINAGTLSKNITVNAATQAPTQPTQAPQPQTQAPQPQTQAPQTQAPSSNEEPTTGATEPTSEVTEPVTEDTTTSTVAPNPRTDSNTKLASLTIKGITFDFKSDKYEYNLEVATDITDLEFSYKTYKENATVKISSTKLVEGMNKIEVVVSFEGESTTYKLNINKKKKTDSKAQIIKIAKIVGSLAGMIGLTYLLIVVIKK